MSLFFVNQFSAMVVWHHKQDAVPIAAFPKHDRAADVIERAFGKVLTQENTSENTRGKN
jgi:hypothetical protein